MLMTYMTTGASYTGIVTQEWTSDMVTWLTEKRNTTKIPWKIQEYLWKTPTHVLASINKEILCQHRKRETKVIANNLQIVFEVFDNIVDSLLIQSWNTTRMPLKNMTNQHFKKRLHKTFEYIAYNQLSEQLVLI